MRDHAATEANAAARLDGRWHQLATDMSQIAGLPETGNTLAQESAYTHDNQQIVALCSSLLAATTTSTVPAVSPPLSSTATTAGSALASGLPGVISDCNAPAPQDQQAEKEPSSISFACADGNSGVKNVIWGDWTSTSASGAGQFFENDCTPDCAQGAFKTYEASFSLSGVTQTSAGPLFSQLEATFQGAGPQGRATEVFSLPLPPE